MIPTPMLQVTTESGATYDYDDDNRQIRRKKETSQNDRWLDGAWRPCQKLWPEIGERMVIFYLDATPGDGHTVRITTPITELQGADEL